MLCRRCLSRVIPPLALKAPDVIGPIELQYHAKPLCPIDGGSVKLPSNDKAIVDSAFCAVTADGIGCRCADRDNDDTSGSQP